MFEFVFADKSNAGKKGNFDFQNKRKRFPWKLRVEKL